MVRCPMALHGRGIGDPTVVHIVPAKRTVKRRSINCALIGMGPESIRTNSSDNREWIEKRSAVLDWAFLIMELFESDVGRYAKNRQAASVTRLFHRSNLRYVEKFDIMQCDGARKIRSNAWEPRIFKRGGKNKWRAEWMRECHVLAQSCWGAKEGNWDVINRVEDAALSDGEGRSVTFHVQELIQHAGRESTSEDVATVWRLRILELILPKNTEVARCDCTDISWENDE